MLLANSLVRLCSRTTSTLPLGSCSQTRFFTKKSLTSDPFDDAFMLEMQSQAQDHSLLMQHYHLKVLDYQQVLVVQPKYDRSNPMFKNNTTTELMMEETIGLVKTIGWRVIDDVTMSVKSDSRNFARHYLGEGQLQKLRNMIEYHEAKNRLVISAVFISADKIRSIQRVNMEAVLGRPIFDRYSLILQIFNKHAMTMEAKLQVQLAEIPYLKSRLVADIEIENEMKHSPKRKGKEWFDKQRLLLVRREKLIKTQIEKIKVQRKKLRANRTRTKNPTVSVIGYTNAGKTALIKAITGTEKLQPKDELFATLDVSAHPTTLPSQMDSYFIDTVGFISDIPTELIASFNATLEDALLADLLIHVRNISHPDHVAQNANVQRILQTLQMPSKLMNSIITVGNKVDLLPHPEDRNFIRQDGMIPISTRTGENMEELVDLVDKYLTKETKRVVATFRVATGSEEFGAIMKELAIRDIQVCDQDSNFTLIETISFDYEVNKFQEYLVV